MDEVVEYLKARSLIGQYKKAKQYLLAWNKKSVDFKERNPKGKWIYYFRINKQFRAIATMNTDGYLLVSKIDNHQ